MTFVFGGTRDTLAQSAVLRDVWFENACDRPIRLLLRHADQDRRWQSRGWWQIAAGDPPKALTSSGHRIQHLSNHRLYFYAEALDGSVTWEGDGQISAHLAGVAYRMRVATPTMVRGRLQVRLSCTGPAVSPGRGAPKT
jgi:hypothetical protein